MTTDDQDEPLLRIGHGFDIHRLIEGTPLVIGGTYGNYKNCSLSTTT